ncbi:iron donor protein CyaY [Actimicrobium sp. CCC2.4]|uniref:iron donor protein CyaY n=1 Tax=Actimicrobium sp. CCC2.4 TaxID=3048606 RepID=UPI002AC9134C|nr:iron donor protein CyaY [Actimicrobium sp. CCC2.4]MEB0135464.1 iron donor protein CyaY [Actimicrobium sp. CCC2.4]WPX32362.1 iron donor protein CyaY [Actimicrobium sp. CCC2.4]
MTESDFLTLADAVLSGIEAALERPDIVDAVDVECSRSGNVLEIEFVDTGSKIIVNSQAPMREMWVAAKSGGYHYKYDGQQWCNTRDDSELFTALSAMISQQGGAEISIAARGV